MLPTHLELHTHISYIHYIYRITCLTFTYLFRGVTCSKKLGGTMGWVVREASLFLKFEHFLWGNNSIFPCSVFVGAWYLTIIFSFFGGTEYTLSPLTQTLGGTRPPVPPMSYAPVSARNLFQMYISNYVYVCRGVIWGVLGGGANDLPKPQVALPPQASTCPPHPPSPKK